LGKTQKLHSNLTMSQQYKKAYNFFENVFSLFSVKAIDLGIAIWLIPYLIYKVGLQNYGLYAFAISLVLYFVNIINYSFDFTAVRELASDSKKNVPTIFNEVFTVKLYLTSLFLIVLILLALLFPIFSSQKLVYLFGLFLLIAELFSLRWFFYGIEKMKFIPAIQLVGTLVNVILVLLFVKQPENYVYIILFEGLGLLVANSISFLYIVLEYKIHLKLISFHTVKKYLYHNFYAFINVMVPSMLSNTAVFLMGLFSIPAYVSIVQISVKFSNAFSTINTILTKVFYSLVNRQRHFMKTSFRVLTVVGAILSLAMFISADILIEPWLKLENTTALNNVVLMVKILSPMPLIMALISAYGVNGLLVSHKDKMVGVITISTTAIGIIIGVILIPIYTFIGGAIFLLTVRGLYALLSVILFKKNVNVNLKQNKV